MGKSHIPYLFGVYSIHIVTCQQLFEVGDVLRFLELMRAHAYSGSTFTVTDVKDCLKLVISCLKCVLNNDNISCLAI